MCTGWDGGSVDIKRGDAKRCFPSPSESYEPGRAELMERAPWCGRGGLCLKHTRGHPSPTNRPNPFELRLGADCRVYPVCFVCTGWDGRNQKGGCKERFW